MVNLYIGITDYEWFRFLSVLPGVDEVNFWQPGGRTNFQALRPGELFLVKLHAPRNFIVGGGVFARADILPTSLAWEAFGTSNGASSLTEMRRRIAFYRGIQNDPRDDYRILAAAFSRNRSFLRKISGSWCRLLGLRTFSKVANTTPTRRMADGYGKQLWTTQPCRRSWPSRRHAMVSQP